MNSPNSPAAAGARAQYLDLLKTLLVYGMIAAHVIQLITFGPKAEARAFSEYINLITFSGFMFAFGIGLGLPRSGERRRSAWQRLRPALLLLAGVYLSSLGFLVLVEREPLTWPLLYDVLTMTRLFGWSEFLATFFVLYVLIALTRPWLLKLGQNVWLLGATVALGLATTLLIVDAALPLVAAVFSTTRFPNFPLLPYLPWLLLGIWYGSRPLNWWHFLPAAAATAAFYYVAQHTGETPQRFPPTALWVVGPAVFLLLYLLVSRTVAGAVRIPNILLMPGRHVLSFLVLSNLIIFAARYFYSRPVRDTLTVALVALAIIAGLSVLWLVLERLSRRSA